MQRGTVFFLYISILLLLVPHSYTAQNVDKGLELPKENLISNININININNNISDKMLLIYIESENKIIFNNTSVYKGYWYPLYLYNPTYQSVYLEKYYVSTKPGLESYTPLSRYLGKLDRGWYKLWVFFGRKGWVVIKAVGDNCSSNHFWIKVKEYNLTREVARKRYSKVGTPKVIIDYVRMPRVVYKDRSFSITIMLKNFESQGVTIDLQCFSSATGLFYSEKGIYVPPKGEIGRVLLTSAKSVGSRTLTFIIKSNGVILDSLKMVLIVINP